MLVDRTQIYCSSSGSLQASLGFNGSGVHESQSVEEHGGSVGCLGGGGWEDLAKRRMVLLIDFKELCLGHQCERH